MCVCVCWLCRLCWLCCFGLCFALLQLYARRPIFQGESDVTQIDAICAICGTPSKQDWPEMIAVGAPFIDPLLFFFFRIFCLIVAVCQCTQMVIMMMMMMMMLLLLLLRCALYPASSLRHVQVEEEVQGSPCRVCIAARVRRVN